MANTKRVLHTTFTSVAWAIRMIIFSALFYVRGLITAVLRFVASMCLLGFVAGVVIMPRSDMTWGFLWYGLGAFVMAMLYDIIVLWLKPDDGTELELWH